jgi:iron complex outermembrane receptor protein
MHNMNKLSLAVALAASAASTVHAAPVLEEVMVTATKRTASLQDVAIAVQAMGETKLDQMGVANFDDYLIQLPGVTAGGAGPGQSTIYIRGVASTTPALSVAGVAGLAPNVAFYLDEQPLGQPGRNLDVYAADLNRIEVLAGPQGTLFGASSQAGTVRLITNKPDPSGVYGKVKMGTSFTQGGDMSNNVEGMMNIPVNDKLTLRGVVFTDHKGGFVDNVYGERSFRESARFVNTADTVRSNGLPYGARAGFQAGVDLSNVTFHDMNNSDLVEENFNSSTYAGARLSALYNINDNWTLNVAHMQQSLESDGVFWTDPSLDDHEIQRFAPDTLEDSFSNTSWTLEGMLGELETVYTGAYTTREADQVADYSEYLFVGQYFPYYNCDYYVTYTYYTAGVPTGTCYEPYAFTKTRSDSTAQTHELRFSTDASKKTRATFGAFYSDFELKELVDFTYLNQEAEFFGTKGFKPNYPFQGAWNSDPGPFPSNVAFRNDIRRTDENWGVFGELSYDMTEALTLTVGARYYDYKVDMEGTANSSFCNPIVYTDFGFPEGDIDAFGTNISDIYDGDGVVTNHYSGGCREIAKGLTYTNNAEDIAYLQSKGDVKTIGALTAPDAAEDDGIIGKINLSYAPDADSMYYFTMSEGYRTGLLNRPGGAASKTGNYTVPFDLKSDELTNYEFGWKLDMLDGTFRFNGSVFFLDIQNLQTTIFDTSIVNLFFSDNAADAEVKGVEGDFTWLLDESWTLTGAFSMLDTEITKSLVPTNDIVVGDELAFAPSYQANVAARYTWTTEGGMEAHIMPHIVTSDGSYSDIININRIKTDSYVMAGITAGVETEKWSATMFIENLTNEKAQLSATYINDRERYVLARPMTVGIRTSFNF